MIITRDNFEKLLDEGRLEVEMRNGRWWRIRRNGATKRWKREPSHFRTPVKAGIRSCGQIEHTDLVVIAGVEQFKPDFIRLAK